MRRYCRLRVWVGLVAALVLAMQASGLDEPIAPERVVFKTTQDAQGQPVELELHVFKPDGWQASDRRPAIVFFFGGGWINGTPEQFYNQSRDLAELGLVAVSAEYRIRSKHGTPPQACVEDGKSAVRYLRKHAAALGIDPNRIAAGGGSAGGHVAACTGVIKGFDAPGEDLAISSVPNLMVLFNPVIDTSIETGYGGKRVGKDPLVLSPRHQAHKDQPPCVIFTGKQDRVTTLASMRGFIDRSEASGASVKLHVYEPADHGFFNHRDFRKPSGEYFYPQVMRDLLAFLKLHGYVEEK